MKMADYGGYGADVGAVSAFPVFFPYFNLIQDPYGYGAPATGGYGGPPGGGGGYGGPPGGRGSGGAPYGYGGGHAAAQGGYGPPPGAGAYGGAPDPMTSPLDAEIQVSVVSYTISGRSILVRSSFERCTEKCQHSSRAESTESSTRMPSDCSMQVSSFTVMLPTPLL